MAGYTSFVVAVRFKFLISFFIWCVCVRFIFRAFLFALSTSSCVGVGAAIPGVGCTGLRLQCLPFWFCSSRRALGTGYCSLVGLMFLPKCISIRHISHASLPSHVHRACMHWTMHSLAHRGITRCQCPAQLQVQS